MFVRALFVSALALLGLAAAGLFRAEPQAATASPKLYAVGALPFTQISSASCAAAACHGGGEVGKVGSEHSTWAPEVFPDGPTDPHARAYRVLFNADSARMGKLLGIAAPHKEALCLKCHAVDGVKPEPAISEGVGCGACHGPAEKWLGAHVQPGWKELSNRDKWDHYGFVPAGNLVARSLNCTGCHVGDADREVNHDLIAAGHPRLAFESTRFHFNPTYRKHWHEKTPQPDFEVRAWVCGQAATLRAATDLLRARAERAAADDPKTPWPEFAGYSCYSCHQKIGTDEPRGGTGDPKRPVGIPGWELWSNTAAGVAANLSAEAYPGVAVPELKELAVLRKLMEKRVPDPKAVAAQARKAVAELDAWLAELQAADDNGRATRIASDAPRKFTHALTTNALADKGTRLADHDWDALTANYLGCAAMYHASGGQGLVPHWTDPIRGLTENLKFPVGDKGERFDNPAAFGVKERERVRKQFLSLFDATATPGEKR